jgi:hypothetical protein
MNLTGPRANPVIPGKKPAAQGGARHGVFSATAFATQLDGTRQNRLVQPQGWQRLLGPKTLTD